MRPRAKRTGLALLTAFTLASCADPPAVDYQGYLEADYAYVGAPVAGRLVQLPVQRGTNVEAGTPLFALDGELERQQLAEAQGRLQQAQAQRDDLNLGRRPDEIQVITERVREARSSLTLAERELKRAVELQKRGLTSDDLRDRAAATHAQAQARLASTLAEQRSAELAGRPDTQKAADAAIAAAQAVVGQASWRVEQTRVDAIAAGRVEDTLYQIGEWVPAGAPVVKLLPDQGPFVRFFVPLAELSQWAPGTVIAIDCEGCEATQTARVEFIAAAPEYTPPIIFSESRNDDLVYRIEARFEAPTRLAPGLPVRVRR
ncbi:MAG TPA: HlyD family efflux transporter periplasmic adaptor subunit [Xanthomonadales bacterium]|nr:HlyD family efflux transporter periplasmic adaptor subunit [Xanthomonadales bacterium]